MSSCSAVGALPISTGRSIRSELSVLPNAPCLCLRCLVRRSHLRANLTFVCPVPILSLGGVLAPLACYWVYLVYLVPLGSPLERLAYFSRYYLNVASSVCGSLSSVRPRSQRVGRTRAPLLVWANIPASWPPLCPPQRVRSRPGMQLGSFHSAFTLKP